MIRRYSYLTKSCWKPWGCCPRCQVASVLSLVNFRNRLTQLRSCFRVVLSNSEVVLSNSELWRLATSNSATCARQLATCGRQLFRRCSAAASHHCCCSAPLLLRSTAAPFGAALLHSLPTRAAENLLGNALASSCVAGCWRCDPSQGACCAHRCQAP